MSARIVDRAIAAAGLDRWLARRLARDLTALDREALERRLPDLDVLVLGALADRVRAAECGDGVRVHLQRPGDEGVFVLGEAGVGGEAFVRAAARQRLLGPEGAPVRIDVDAAGIEIAQVALAFGATEWIAPVRRSVITESAILRERELAALVRSAARTPRIVEWLAGVAHERDVDSTSAAKKRFRAPGRDVPTEDHGESQ